MDVHRGDDLEVVDEHHRLFAGLRDVAGHLALDVVKAGLVVALPEVDVSGVGGVGVPGGVQMGLFLGGVLAPPSAVQHAASGLGHAPPDGGVQQEALPGDGAGHQLPRHHFQGEHQHVSPLLGQLVSHLHTEGGLAQGTDRADDVQAVVQAAVQGLVDLGEAGFQRRAGGLLLDVGEKVLHPACRRGLLVGGRLLCRPVGGTLGEEAGGLVPVMAEGFVEILAVGHGGTAVEPRKFRRQRRGPRLPCRIAVRQQQDGGGLGQGTQEGGGLLPVAGAVESGGMIAQFLGGEGVEGALKEEDGGSLPCPGQQLRLEQRRGAALFVEVALLGDGPADAAAVFAGKDYAVMLGIVA